MTPDTYTLVTIIQTGLVIVAVIVSLALVHQANASRDRARAEVQQLRDELKEAQLTLIEARNPGIDIERVRRERAER